MFNFSSTDDELRVEVHNFENTIELGMRKHVPHLIQHLSKPRRKVGVLISGSGTNLQALIDATQNDMESIGAEIVIVISNKENVEGLKRAERAGIATKVGLVDHYSKTMKICNSCTFIRSSSIPLTPTANLLTPKLTKS